MNPVYKILSLAAAVLGLTALTGCDSFIYDDEGDCNPYYKVRFVYDYNMKYADAFPAEVNEVTLYVVDDATGKIVWQKHEAGEQLKSGDYLMDVDVAPGTYSLIAWAGEGHTTHFSVPSVEHYSGLQCTLGRGHNAEGGAEIRNDINRLYHGRIDATEFTDEHGVHIYTVPLVKNTNDINVVLRHLSGEPVDHQRFTFTITDSNGLMDWDNTLLDDEQLTYYAYNVGGGTASLPDDESPARVQTSVSAAIADLTVARLVKGQDARLTVYRDGDVPVLSIPLIETLLLTRSGHYAHMSEQEYLDREDHYSMIFFLDDQDRWIDAYIYINSWKIVINNVGV